MKRLFFLSAVLAGAYAMDEEYEIGIPAFPSQENGPKLLSSLDVSMQTPDPKDISGPGFIRAMMNPRNKTYDLMISSFGMFQQVYKISHLTC